MNDKLTKSGYKKVPTQEQIDFGKRLADTRRLRGFSSQSAFAEKLGIVSASVAYYEIGARKPDYAMFAKMADVLEVSYDYLLGRTEVKERENIDIFERLGLTDETVAQIQQSRANGSIDVARCLNLLCKPGTFEIIFEGLHNFFDLDTCIRLHSAIQDEIYTAANMDVSLMFIETVKQELIQLRKEVFLGEREHYIKEFEGGNLNGEHHTAEE